MAELETVQTAPENQPLPETQPTKTEKFKAGVKERFRKFIVKLKHKPHIIPLVILLITSIVYLCILNSLSYLVSKISGVDSAGICIFVNTLASILVLLVFLNAFPKRKKPNIIMIVITFVVMALIFALDLVFYFKVTDYCVKAYGGMTVDFLDDAYPVVYAALNNTIAHAVLIGISILTLAFLPLYKMGIKKINTKKVIAENVIKEEIDTSAEV